MSGEETMCLRVFPADRSRIPPADVPQIDSTQPEHRRAVGARMALHLLPTERERSMCAMATLHPRPDRRHPESRAQLLERIRGEFREMPCLRLTGGQVRRLFALRADVCDRVLSTLMAEGTLVRGLDGRYAVPGDVGSRAFRIARREDPPAASRAS
jgi:hypothetical protein